MQAAVLGGDGVPVLALEWLSGTVERLCASSGDGLVSLYAVGTDSMVFRNSVSMSAPVIMLAHTQTKLLCGSAQGDISILQQVSAAEFWDCIPVCVADILPLGQLAAEWNGSSAKTDGFCGSL